MENKNNKEMSGIRNETFFRRVEKYEKGAKKDLKIISSQIADLGKLVGKLREMKVNMFDMVKLVDEFKVGSQTTLCHNLSNSKHLNIPHDASYRFTCYLISSLPSSTQHEQHN